MEKGEIRIGTLYDFRDVERLGPEIGDKDEGTKTLTADGFQKLDTGTPETIANWLKDSLNNSIRTNSDGRLVICAGSGIRSKLSVPDRYVYCSSYEFDAALISNGEYDACLEIFNPEAFITAISNKLKNRGHFLASRQCTYKTRLIPGDMDTGFDPSFLKEERHSYQKEMRSVWIPYRDKISPINIYAKKAKFHCRVIR